MMPRRWPSRKPCANFWPLLDLTLVKGGNLRANHFNGILAKAKDKAYQTMVNEMVLRAQSKAIYSPKISAISG